MIGLWERDSTKTVSFTVVGILLIDYIIISCGEGTEDPPEDTVYPVYYPPHTIYNHQQWGIYWITLI